MTPTSISGCYLDDGQTLRYRNGEYRQIDIRHHTAANRDSLTFNLTHDGYKIPAKEAYVKFWTAKIPAAVLLNGVRLDKAASTADVSSSAGYCYNRAEKAVTVKIPAGAGKLDLEIVW